MTDATTTAAADTSQTSTTAAPATPPAASPAAPPATPPAQQADWRETVTGDDLKAHAKNFNSVTDLVKGHFELRKKLSSSITPPGKDAKPEEIAAYRQKIGVPESADGYKFTMPEGKEATDADKALHARWAKAFHDLDIPAEKAAKLNETANAIAADMQKAMADANKTYADQTIATLKKEWGNDFEANKTYANRAATVVFGSEFESFRQIKDSSGNYVGDNPVMLKALAKLGREMGEDGLKGTMTQDQRAGMESEYHELTKKIHNANERGDRIEAQRLFEQRNSISAKLHAA